MYVAKENKESKTQNKKQECKQKQNTEQNKRKRTGYTKYKGWYLLNTW